MICGSCGNETFGAVMSMFDDTMICLDCLEKEKAHPMYQTATESELAAVRRGDFNFAGIGVPTDIPRILKKVV